MCHKPQRPSPALRQKQEVKMSRKPQKRQKLSRPKMQVNRRLSAKLLKGVKQLELLHRRPQG